MTERALDSREIARVADEAPPPWRTPVDAPASSTTLSASPTLAPDVELLGQLQGSAFAEPQWLVRRSEAFIQLSELLYRVLERLDGVHTLEEVAAHLTNVTPWRVTPENVRQVIELKLAPLGLVGAEAADGRSSRPADLSPMRISGRRRLVSARAVQAVSGFLAPLFSPFAIVPAFALVIAAHVWLYFMRGAGESLHLALYTPAGLLIVLGLALGSSFFHELGHAAALRYSGGNPGGIGAGFYLVYPTLFTNTSDAYRLSRGARIRTDLGGMYFHLLFAVAIAALAIAIHQPVLLAVVVLIDLEIVYQFLPTARLDGYWTIADALGVPDPISQARLQVAPVGRQRGARAAAVRPRAAAALGAYLLTSLLLMAAVLALTIVDLPQIVRKAAGIFHRNAHVFGQAFGRGDVLVAAAVSVQLVLLALILVAVCLMVYRSSHSAVRVLAGWSRSNRRRRSITLACATTILAATALLWSRGFFWAPHLPLMPGQGAAAPIGTRTFAVASSGPVAGTITYDVHPAVGGPYAKQWQTCGFYTTPVVESRAVHSLARGAVWIAYRPTLAGPERALLHAVTEQLRFVLAAPYSGLRSPFVLTAWKHQLALHSLADPRFAQFIAAFRLSRQAPEHGRPCKGGVGAPAR